MSEYRYTEDEGRPGIWAQGEGVFFPDVPPHVSVHALYREGMRLAEIAVETGPGIDGLAARALRKEAIALRAEVGRLRATLAEIGQAAHGAHGGRGSFRWCGERCCDLARRAEQGGQP